MTAEDQDRAWMLRTVAEAAAARPHATTVMWEPGERGVPQFAAACRACGYIAISPDEARIRARAREHEAACQ